MKLVVKAFQELSVQELYEIYKLRSAVFVVEQQCAYQDVDELDLMAYHLWLEEDGAIQAYARVLPVNSTTAFMGRVIAVKRRCGLGTAIVQHTLQVAREKLGAKRITIEAQTYAKGLYEKAGFVQVSEEFIEDGIPHIRMEQMLV